MTFGVQPLRQAARGVVRQARVDELAMFGIQHRLGARQRRHQLLRAQARDSGDFRFNQQLRKIQAFAQLCTGCMHITDAHLADLQQVIDGLLVALLLEEMAERAGHFATDVGHALEQRPRQVADQLQITEPLRQRLGRALAHVFDAEREQ
ncbi:hypothetical protein G6F63_013534 [Rhizopus arrhizus]|nr:hypothetical protein G6F63_013534 [Rhizopus arrhizus]